MTEAATRKARHSDAKAIKEIVDGYARDGILLPRSLEDITRHIGGFHVATIAGGIVGVGALHSYGGELAEIRSLAVKRELRRSGIGKKIAQELVHGARAHGVSTVFVMTVVPEFFETMAFRRVTHESLPEKVWKDCVKCAHYNTCDEIALICTLKPHEDYQQRRSGRQARRQSGRGSH